MSYAVIQTGGKQYKVRSGEILKIEKLPNSKSDSKVEFKDDRDNPDSKWMWYPGFRPDENGKNAGTMIISPYISVNF